MMKKMRTLGILALVLQVVYLISMVAITVFQSSLKPSYFRGNDIFIIPWDSLWSALIELTLLTVFLIIILSQHSRQATSILPEILSIVLLFGALPLGEYINSLGNMEKLYEMGSTYMTDHYALLSLIRNTSILPTLSMILYCLFCGFSVAIKASFKQEITLA